jgi:hypothetical protein
MRSDNVNASKDRITFKASFYVTTYETHGCDAKSECQNDGVLSDDA